MDRPSDKMVPNHLVKVFSFLKSVSILEPSHYDKVHFLEKEEEMQREIWMEIDGCSSSGDRNLLTTCREPRNSNPPLGCQFDAW